MKFSIKHVGLSIAAISICLLLVSFRTQKKVAVYTSRELLNDLLQSISNVKTMRYSLQCTERIKGKIQHTESKVKLQISPRKLYLSLKGPEVLWIQGENGGDALVNPSSFPYINLNLDPFGAIMRKDQHHTIHEMGLHYLADILKDGIRRAGNNLDKDFVIIGEEKHDGRDCYKLSIAFPDYSWKSYLVKKGENLTTIARKLHVSEYMVLENNPHLSWYNDVKEGQIIQVPDAYAKLTVLLIDKEYLLPVFNKIYDDKGLFETYEYHNLIINSPILPEEFSRDYKDYNF
jgi:outer membrane lipoprotein-sorting protein